MDQAYKLWQIENNPEALYDVHKARQKSSNAMVGKNQRPSNTKTNSKVSTLTSKEAKAMPMNDLEK